MLDKCPSGVLKKIELFNKLQKELKEVYGEFDTIDIVDEYPKDIRVNTDGIHYYDIYTAYYYGFFIACIVEKS